MKLKIIFLSLITIIYTSVFVYTNTETISDGPNNNQQEISKENIMIGNVTYNSLQEAIDNAKENDIIDIYQDITENIIISNMNIIINGNNHRLMGTNYVFDYVNTIKAIIEVENSKLVINNLVIDGMSGIDENIPNIGIYINNTSLELNNVTINNINHHVDKLTHHPYGTGIYVVNSSDAANNLKVLGCTIDNFHQTGIYINNHSNLNYNVEIKNNLINGIGKTLDVEQRGIVIYGEVSGEISQNKINNIYYLNSTKQDRQIIINDELPLLIVNNNIYNN